MAAWTAADTMRLNMAQSGLRGGRRNGRDSLSVAEHSRQPWRGGPSPASGILKKIADGEPWTMPATIDDRSILYEIARLLKDKS